MSCEVAWKFRIAHILDAIDKILRYTQNASFQTFAADERTVDAVIRNFLVIGEASRHIPAQVRAATPRIPWALMEAIRHILVRDYETVRLDIVWKTITDDLPPLRVELLKIQR